MTHELEMKLDGIGYTIFYFIFLIFNFNLESLESAISSVSFPTSMIIQQEMSHVTAPGKALKTTSFIKIT